MENKSGIDTQQKYTDNNVDSGSKKQPRARLMVIIILATLSLLAGLILGWLIRNNTNNPNQGTTQTAICGDQDVDAYNGPIMAENPPADYSDTFDALKKDIKGRPDNQQDATCQYLLYAISFMRANNDVQDYINQLKILNANGGFPNNKIFQMRDLNTIEWLGL